MRSGSMDRARAGTTLGWTKVRYRRRTVLCVFVAPGLVGWLDGVFAAPGRIRDGIRSRTSAHGRTGLEGGWEDSGLCYVSIGASARIGFELTGLPKAGSSLLWRAWI